MTDPSELLSLMPLAATLDIGLEAASADQVVATMPWAPGRCTAGGVLHGGALMALADTAGAVCAFLALPPGARTTTTSSTTHLLRPVSGGVVRATARPVHRGRTQSVIRTDLVDDDGRLVATTVQAQAVLPAP